LGVLGVVLIPGSVASFAEASLRDRGDRDDLEAFLEQAVSQRAVVVAGRLKRYPDASG
jgi:hypothetical protein